MLSFTLIVTTCLKSNNLGVMIRHKSFTPSLLMKQRFPKHTKICGKNLESPMNEHATHNDQGWLNGWVGEGHGDIEYHGTVEYQNYEREMSHNNNT